MQISQTLADNIVKEMKDIISFDLNFMDISGKIIASTDINRIGQVNMASFESMKVNKSIVVNYDGEYENAKKGINIPVNFESNVIGTIGITGEPDKVIGFATVIKKMTEILITEEWINRVKQNELDDRKLFLENMIFYQDENIIHNQQISDKTQKVIIAGYSSTGLNDADFNSRIEKQINTFLRNYQFNSYVSILRNRIIILMDNIGNTNIQNLVSDMDKNLQEKFEIVSYFGISNKFKELSLSKERFEQANSTLMWILRIEKDEIKNLGFNSQDLGVLFSNINQQDIDKFKYEVLSNLNYDEIEEYKRIIKLFTEHNGSINKTSEELFIHKNTLQYKLNKLEKLTGYNPRKLSDYLVLRLAFLFK